MKSPKVIITHPENLKEARIRYASNQHPFEDRRAIPIYPSYHIERFMTKYVPPPERFIEYEESDYAWLQYFGYGHFEQDEEMPLFYEVDFQMINKRDLQFKIVPNLDGCTYSQARTMFHLGHQPINLNCVHKVKLA